VTATGVRLSYSEKDRQVKLEGPTEMRMPDATLSANRVELFLRAKNASSAAPSQIDRAIAHQDVLIAQKNPARKATGETLIYTAADEKFVLTGTPEKPPSIFDAEHGNVTGDSLTFYNRDDRVQVGGSDSSRTVTRTRVKSESKP
jgi:lipopolysaccharide export system protein LptA